MVSSASFPLPCCLSWAPHVSGLLWSALVSSGLLDAPLASCGSALDGMNRRNPCPPADRFGPSLPGWGVPRHALAAVRRGQEAGEVVEWPRVLEGCERGRGPCCGVLHSVAQRARVRSLTVFSASSILTLLTVLLLTAGSPSSFSSLRPAWSACPLAVAGESPRSRRLSETRQPQTCNTVLVLHVLLGSSTELVIVAGETCSKSHLSTASSTEP